MRNYSAVYYWNYPLLMMAVTWCFARVLYRAGQEVAANSLWLNRLLAAGIFVVGFGYLALTLLTFDYFPNLKNLFDSEAMKVGFGLILLGMVFSFDLLVLAVWRRGGVARHARSSELR